GELECAPRSAVGAQAVGRLLRVRHARSSRSCESVGGCGASLRLGAYLRRRLDRPMKARVLPRTAVRRSVVMDPPTPFKRLGPISRLKDFITPTEDVHVLAHLGIARVDPE